ncbi:MAG: glycosyltransferase family 8 protein [bacterium]
MINILCATDNNYVQHCYIMLLSLFDKNSSHEIDVYILVSELTTESKKALNSISANPNHRVILIEVDEKLDYCPVRDGDHISIAAYYRILAPMLLPMQVNKILYLDVDIIICKDISELYNTDISNYAIGAVLDNISYTGIVPLYIDTSISVYNRLNYSSSLGYVNSGVLLMNIDYWREHKIMEECLTYIRKDPDRCLIHDQDAINYVLREQKKLLSIKYNFQTGYLFRLNSFSPDVENELHKIIEEKSFVILHYTYNKPWSKDNFLYKNYYLKYKKISPYAHIPIPRHSIGWRIMRWLYNLSASIGLVKPIKTFIVKNGKLDL